ncbi:oligosaccharyl transferase stt3 subunit [Linderina macrospora]|uniref:Oligosaccharyl transferase stt3 subunit n=1 Tax=Linderina macrospora TaxID=4868 RepID=A0ACC1JG74_9FUNG|nr:oligosaccharyl transferase stt3 subunit [Linderina macrospora]
MRGVEENALFNDRGPYSIGDDASPTMKYLLMHRLLYYWFNGAMDRQSMDLVRRQPLPTDVTIDNFEEAFMSENWMVWIYKVKDLDNLDRDHHKVADFVGRLSSKGIRF